MRLLLFALTVLSVSFYSCDKEPKESVPTCIQERLQSFELNEACNSDASLKKYTFQGSSVYAFNPGYCGADMTTAILSESCNTLGYLGGIAGNSEINGVDFYPNAVFVNTVWSN